jgi:hypothetical protein
MTIDVKKGYTTITMKGYTEETIRCYGVTGIAKTPATNDLFTIQNAEPLDPKGKEDFHAKVAKLLYLAKRTRPDILTACAFLATRVNCSSVEDAKKLERVLKYLNGSRSQGIKLEITGDDLQVRAYIDASFGTHADGKGHTGCVITLGKGPIHVRSAKQKLVAKSSSEAELIALSDELSQVIWTSEFLKLQGYRPKPSVVYQDNKSTIVMAAKGKHTGHTTRHINIRYLFVKDRMERGDVEVEYVPTTRMIADLMTKPLQGQLFRSLRERSMNWQWGCNGKD